MEEDVSNDDESNEVESENESSNSIDEADADNEEDIVDDDDAEENTGWANTFATLLKQEKPKNKKYLVLSKAKKLADKKKDEENEKPKVTFEIDGKESSDDDDEETKPTSDDLKLDKLMHSEREQKLLNLRVKPSPLDRERERSLKRIATKGVVQLFNAVRSQQKDLAERLEEAGPLDHKRDAVLNNINKSKFLDVLMGGKRAKSENVDNPIKDEIKTESNGTKPSQWSVLRDDFMTNKKISSHWDDEEHEDEVKMNETDDGDE